MDKTENTCNHVIFMNNHVIFINANGPIRYAFCGVIGEPTHIKYPRLAWLWVNYWIIKQKVKHALGI